jgi:FG-GAP repeat
MRHFVLTIVLIVGLLAACGQPPQAPNTTPNEHPLFTDADIDKAQLQIPTEMTELVGRDEGTASEGQILPALADSSGELSAQAVLPNTSGFVFYVQYLPGFNGADDYSLYRHNQRTDTRELIYSGNRYIQSVAGSSDSTMVVVSMRETTDATSDLDIFLFNVSDPANPAIFLLSFDSVDNTNVSMSADANRIVNEEPVAGKASVVLRTKQPFALYTSAVLTNTLPQRQPSISGSGQYITLVRDLANGSDRVLRYTLASNSYLTIATSTAVLEYPSISNDGNKVLWLQNGATTDLARLRNIAAGTTQTVLTVSFIGHPFLTGDGLFMTYQSGRNIFTKNLGTAQVQVVASSPFNFISFYAPMWQMFPNNFETQKVSRLTPFGEFGSSVGIDGDLAVVGEPKGNGGTGAAHILQRTAGVWSIVKTLLASDGAAEDNFGYAVSISGDTVIVGAPFDDRAIRVGGSELPDIGSAYIFQKDQGGSGQWGQVKKLVGIRETLARANFGEAVDIAGDTAVVGAPGNTGAVFIFMRNVGATVWGQTKKILPGDFANGFGKSVSVSFDTVVVGAPYGFGNAESGSAYIFLRNQGGAGKWGQVKKLLPNEAVRFGQFGYSVAVSQNTIVVGARYQDIDINHNGLLECNDVSSDECTVGAAYVFERNQGGTEAWGQVKKLSASDMAEGDTFGYSVAIWGDLLVVGAPNKPVFNSVGAAYVFGRFQGGVNGWGQVKKLEASDAFFGFYLGYSVSISGSRVVLGAPRFTNNDGASGEAVYIYE